MSMKAEVPGDMGEGLKLQLFVEEDGDVIVSILPIDHVFTRNSVQFCTLMGGGKNPKVTAKLRELVAVINGTDSESETDEETRMRELVKSLGQ